MRIRESIPAKILHQQILGESKQILLKLMQYIDMHVQEYKDSRKDSPSIDLRESI